MGKQYSLDANAVIDYVGDKIPRLAAIAMDNLINDELNTSSLLKSRFWVLMETLQKCKSLTIFLALATIFHLDDVVAEKTIDLRKRYKKLKLGDAIIAATALVHGFTILTRNAKDFQYIGGLDCINPHELS